MPDEILKRTFNTTAFDVLWGNGRLKRVISAAAASGALGHAYIFEGAPGSGRHTAALFTAMSAACGGDLFPCLTCEACRKLRAGISPDYITVLPEGDRKTLGVESVRSIADTVYIVPNDLDVKFYLIPDADSMTPQAQNALLKLLEEPPLGVYFFLLCDNSANLLPTVKSRAPTIKMQKFMDADLAQYLLAHDKNAEKLKAADEHAFERCVRLSDGSIGAALNLLNSKKSSRMSELYGRADKFFKLLAERDRAEFTVFLISLADKRDELSELLGLISGGARDLIARKYGSGTPPAFFAGGEAASSPAASSSAASALAGAFTAEKLFFVAEAAESARADLQSNANISTALTSLAARLYG